MLRGHHCYLSATWFVTCPLATAGTCRIPRALCLLQALGSLNISGVLHPLPVPQRDQELLKLNSFINGMVLVDQN